MATAAGAEANLSSLAAASAPLLAFAAVCGAPAAAVRLRAALRPALEARVRAGVHFVAATQRRWRDDGLTELLKTVAFAVSVPFYAAVLPLCFWARRPVANPWPHGLLQIARTMRRPGRRRRHRPAWGFDLAAHGAPPPLSRATRWASRSWATTCWASCPCQCGPVTQRRTCCACRARARCPRRALALGPAPHA